MNAQSKVNAESLIALLKANFLEHNHLNAHSSKEKASISPLIDFAQSCLKKDSFLGLFNMAPQMLMRKNAKMLDFLINFKIATTFLGYILTIFLSSLCVNAFMPKIILPNHNYNIGYSLFLFYPFFAIIFHYIFIKKFIL